MHLSKRIIKKKKKTEEEEAEERKSKKIDADFQQYNKYSSQSVRLFIEKLTGMTLSHRILR